MSRPQIPNYQIITSFFSCTSVTQNECDTKALSLTASPTTPILSQGHHSYTLYAQNQVVQFRLASRFLDLETQALAERIYGDLVPKIIFEGEMGDDDEENGREPVCVYLMNRMQGVAKLEFMKGLAYSDGSQEMVKLNNSVQSDMAQFLALGWKSPQTIKEDHRNELKDSYLQKLQNLLQSSDTPFHGIVKTCISALDDILALPFVLQHKDLSDTNILVHPESGQITGVLDWSDATTRPFGMNLHAMGPYAAHLRLDEYSLKLSNFENEEKTFWEVLENEVGVLGEGVLEMIKKARVLGFLMDRGFVEGEG